MARLPSEIVINLISFVPYDDLTKFLESLHFSPKEINNIKRNEYHNRSKYVDYLDDDYNAVEEFRFEGRLHRKDGPAYKYTSLDGRTRKWYNRGELHNPEGPAWTEKYGDEWVKKYYIDGKLHREDGPAIESSEDISYYYIQGVRVAYEDIFIKRRNRI